MTFILLTLINNNKLKIARERSPVASNGSGDTSTHPDDLSSNERDNDDGADIQRTPVPARAHRGRVRTRRGARVRVFRRAGQGAGGNRVHVLMAEKDILAKTMPGKEMVLVRLAIGNGKA